jgi:hypothetical protein
MLDGTKAILMLTFPLKIVMDDKFGGGVAKSSVNPKETSSNEMFNKSSSSWSRIFLFWANWLVYSFRRLEKN